MPIISKRSLDSFLAALHKGRDRDEFMWDERVTGFGVRAHPSGSAAYLVQYRTREGRTRRMAIGKVGTLTPEQARDLARDKLYEVSKGGDPSLERHKLRHALSVGELCDLYLKDAEVEGRIKASTLAMDRSRIDTHVKPLIGRRSVSTLTEEDVAEFGAAIVAGKTAREPKRNKDGKRIGRGGVAKGGRGAAARTLGMLSTILEFGRKHRLVRANVAQGVERPTVGKRERFLPLEEIAKLGDALRALANEGESPVALAAIRLLAVTGFRKMEALALPPGWIDSRLRCVRFEDTKTGAQIRPIGAAAVELIEEQKKAEAERHARRSLTAAMAGVELPAQGTPLWVFPAARGDGHLVNLDALDRACARAGLKDVSPHTLRHTFASVAAELGFSELTIAGLLGHRARGITQRYAHVPDSALLAAADRVSARIAAVLDGRTASADVVELQARA